MSIIYSQNLNELLPLTEGYSKVFILADSNTSTYCLPLLPVDIRNNELIIIPAGEPNKNIETCTLIWEKLGIFNADRQSLLINLGGGMITDLGGFAASTYKRGIDFINIPTSLLGMVDAATGGKTGINFLNYKNQIGVFQKAKNVFINIDFLNTLPDREFKSGYAEILKYGLIADRYLWHMFKELPSDSEELNVIISRCVEIKTEITNEDPHETGKRKLLNFGHTAGHAIESLMMEKNTPVLHGEAIAAGMIIECYISMLKGHLASEDFMLILDKIKTFCKPASIKDISITELIELMRHDKKNHHSSIRCTLLKTVGEGIIDVEITEEEIRNAIADIKSK